ncbi:hypothetical protein HDU91_000863, partial [Kappamyces sp. JEL0680]
DQEKRLSTLLHPGDEPESGNKLVILRPETTLTNVSPSGETETLSGTYAAPPSSSPKVLNPDPANAPESLRSTESPIRPSTALEQGSPRSGHGEAPAGPRVDDAAHAVSPIAVGISSTPAPIPAKAAVSQPTMHTLPFYAMHAHTPQSAQEIAIHSGQLIYLISVEPSGWAFGACGTTGTSGWFPVGVLDNGYGRSLQCQDVAHILPH